MKKIKEVIKLVVTLVLFIGIIICYKGPDNVDIYGTVIAKDKITVGRGSQRYLFAIHPDNDTRFVDFDIEVPLHSYVKFDVGDKIVFKDVSTYQKIKNPKWYNDVVEIRIFLSILLTIMLLGWALFLVSYKW